ncbi:MULTISPECIES: hypothetical protein [unclassified Pseudomonas]|uniref:hypothetical protein n=1 Tax=unclassified Pseudomonas TaxID=196821 RepID=UPI0015B73B9B|nr:MULTISPECIES: hypothetical protein [unclassified Pseudomonas]MDY0832523.1 hypothetical protein [Pseudomonas sp. SED1]
MDIPHTDIEFSQRRNITTWPDTPTAINRTSDTHFFNAELSQTKPPGRESATTLAAPLSLLGATASTTLPSRIAKGFRDASQNKNTREANEFPQSLVDGHLEVTAKVKVLSAVTKGIEKVSNMG